MCDADYAAFLAEIDGSGDGKISYSEFAKRFGVGIAGAADQGLLKNRASLAFSRSARKVAPPSTHALTAENAYAALCSKLSVQHKSVRRAWLSADTDASGSLTTDELRALMARYNVVLSDVEYKRLLGMIDLSGDGAIEYDEFLAHFGKGIAGQSGSLSITSSFRAGPGVRQPPNPKWTVAEVEAVLAEKFRINSHSVRKVFLNADEDHSGQLSPDELKQVLRKYNIEMDDGPFRQLVASLDPDGSGDLDYNEFIARWGDTIAGGHSDDSFLREMLNRPAGGREQNDDDESWWSFDDRDNDDPAAEQALVEKAVESVLARPQADNKALGSQASADRYGKAAPAAARSARPRTVGNLTSALRRDRRLQTSESAAALTVGTRRVMKEKLADDVSQARLAQAVTAHYGKLVRALRNLDSRRTGLVLIRDLEATFAKAGVLLDKKSASRLFARHGKASRVKYLDLLRDVTGAAPPLSASASATALGGGGGTGRIRAAQWGPPSRDWAEVTADHDAAMRASTSSRAFR
jgi:Ca2+-binding EF-hand superfamily protein